MLSKGNKRRKAKRHGFIARKRAGGHTLRSRRAKGRHKLV